MSSVVRIGVLALTDSAPLIVAKQLGLFQRKAVEVELLHQPSWSTLRDKLIYGQLDMAQMLAPMAVALQNGLSRTPKRALSPLLVLNRGGNGITINHALHAKLVGLTSGETLGSLIRASSQQKPVVGTVFAYSMHTLLLRRWLRLHDVDPDQDVTFHSVPPLRMVQAMREGELDLFCVGEPWNTVAEQEGLGVVVASSQSLWAKAPEKLLGGLADWATVNPEAFKGVTQAVGEACQWLEADMENRLQAAKWLAQTDYVNLPESYLIKALARQTSLSSAADTQPSMVFDGTELDVNDPNWVALVNETLALARV